MEHTVQIFERREAHSIQWTSVSTTFRSAVSVKSSTPAKVEKLFIEAIRHELRALPPGLRFEFAPAGFVYVIDVRLELVLRGLGSKRDVYGIFPFVVESRPNALGPPTYFYFHPMRPEERYPHSGSGPAEILRPLVQRAWAHLDDFEIEALKKSGKERIRDVVFDERHRTLAEFERERAQALDPNRKPKKHERPPLIELPRLAQDLTRGIHGGSLAYGKARESVDAQLRSFALGTSQHGLPRESNRPMPPSARSFVVIGPSGSGRTTALRRATKLLLAHDGFELTHNLDLVSHVWQLSARRILAGMSRLGEWEKRLLRILDEARAHRAVLAFEDIALLGTIGRSRDSDRAFADLIEGPLARGEIAVWGEATPEGFERLADEAPRLAELLPRLTLPTSDSQETYALLLHRMREVERNAGPMYARDGKPMRLELDPMSIPSIVQETRMLFPGIANPNKSMTILERLSTRAFAVRDAQARDQDALSFHVDPTSVVLDAIEERTGMPRALLDGSSVDPEQLEARFRADIIGQPDAARAVVDLLLRLKTRLTDPSRPRAVYLFTGPTGTGKTETAKWIAKHAYGSGTRLVRFDMAEYATHDGAQRLLGTGLSGAEQEASLTARGRAQPFSVILFDEIEKAHRSVIYLLLQLFDEGRLTDPMGATADFTSAVLVMTSNLGARPKPRAGFSPSSVTESREVLLDVARAVRDFFPPELFHRIDRVVPFRPLDDGMARAIVRRELGSMLQRRGLTERRIAVSATNSVVDLALSEAFDVAGGARSVKGWLEERVGGLLADEIAGGGPSEQRALILYAPRSHEGSRTLTIHAESMREVDPVIEETLDLDPRFDARALRAIADLIAEPLTSTTDDVLTRLRGEQRNRIGHDPRGVYALELSIQAVQAFRDAHELQLEDEVAWERHRHEEELDRVHTIQRGRTYGPNEDRRELHVGARIKGEERQPIGTRALRVHLGVALDLRRSLAQIASPDEHIVDVLIARSGEAREGASSLLPLAHALIDAGGDVDGVVLREGDSGALRVSASLPKKVGSSLALRIVGTGARTKLMREHGTHIFVPDDGVPEMVTVRVLHASDDELRASFEAFESESRAFRDALDAGEVPLPTNPASLLPHLRTVQMQRRTDGTVDVSIEDHRAGDVFHLRARDLRAALTHFQEQRRFVLPKALDVRPLHALLSRLRSRVNEESSS